MAAPPQSSRITRRQLLTASTAALSTAPFITREPVFAQTPAASPGASPVAAGPQLYVSATEVQFDEAFEIGVTGLQPGDEVTIRSDFTDSRGQDWSAEATWQADRIGNVWCSGFPPVSGTFDVADSMAFIWAASTGNPTYHGPALFGPEAVTIKATMQGNDIGNETMLRTILPGRDTSEYINSPELVAQFYEPAAGFPTPAPAVIVLGGSEGGLGPYSLRTAAMLASHGYAALVVAYFGTFGSLPRTLENVPLEYFANAIAWLQERPDVDVTRLGVVGFSRGGELALLLGAYYPDFTAVASYVGSGYVIAGYNPLVQDPNDVQPAWTWGGDAIPYYPFSAAPTAVELEAAEIPVERIDGPVLLISGDGDRLWDSSPLSRIAWDRLQRTEHPWPDQFLHYPGAGHSIGAPYMPMTFDRQAFFDFGGDLHSDHIASVNSWRAVLNMLEWRLKHGG